MFVWTLFAGVTAVYARVGLCRTRTWGTHKFQCDFRSTATANEFFLQILDPFLLFNEWIFDHRFLVFRVLLIMYSLAVVVNAVD